MDRATLINFYSEEAEIFSYSFLALLFFKKQEVQDFLFNVLYYTFIYLFI